MEDALQHRQLLKGGERPSPIPTDIERETTGEQYVESTWKPTRMWLPVAPSVEDLDAVTDDTPGLGRFATDRRLALFGENRPPGTGKARDGEQMAAVSYQPLRRR